MKHLTILLLLFSIVFSSELVFAQQNAENTQQEIIELRKEFDKLQLKNEKLENEIQQLKIDNANTSSKVESFDSNIDSYNNHFGSILQYFFWTVGLLATVGFAILGLLSWKYIFVRFSNIEKTIAEIRNDILNNKNELIEEITLVSKSLAKITGNLTNGLSSIRKDTFRASYLANFYASKFAAAAIFASRCLQYYNSKNDIDNEAHWILKINECIVKLKRADKKIGNVVSEKLINKLELVKTLPNNPDSEGNLEASKQTIELIKQITKQE